MFEFMNPTPQQEGVGPPKDQADYEKRVGAWQQFQTKLQEDPGFRFSFMQAAAHLMQPVQPGQTTLGHVGQAFQTGTQAYALANQAQNRDRMANEKLDMEKRESGARVAHTEAQTGLTREQTTSEGARRAQMDAQTRNVDSERAARDQKLPGEIKLQTEQGNYYGALAAWNKVKTDLEREWGPKEAQAKIAQSQAAAAASFASAAHSQALVKKVNSELDAGKGWQTSAPKVDDNGVVIIASSNRTTGETRLTRSVPPMDFSQAAQRAKAEVDAVAKATPGQLFGTSGDRIAALERLVGEKVKDEQEAVRKLADRYQKGGVYTTVQDKNGVRTLKDESGFGSSNPDTLQPGAPATTAPSIDPEVQQWARANPGRVADIKMKNGDVWRTDGKGGATKTSSGQAQSTSRPSATEVPTSGVLARININDISAAAPVEAQNADLKRLGDALRGMQGRGVQGERADLYSRYYELLQQLGVQ